jgi:hypothetical protein
MSVKNKVVFGIFKTRAEVEHCIDDLKLSSFAVSDISFLTPDHEGSKEFEFSKSSKASFGTASGAGAGAAIGGALGLLVGFGALAIPGVGPFIAAGPLMSALAGVGVGGAIGGVSGGLIGLGMPEFEAKRYEGIIQNGGLLLSVHANSSEDVTRAKKCLEKAGATDVASTGSLKGEWNSYQTESPLRDRSQFNATETHTL